MSSVTAGTTSAKDVRTLYIGGRWRAGDSTFERQLPFDLSKPAGTFSAATGTDVDAAYRAAVAAAEPWGGASALDRAEVLRRAGDILERRLEEAARRLTADMGKAIREARSEVARSVAILRYFSGELQQASGEVYPSADPRVTLLTVEEPMGVVCAITPWNFPFAIPTWKLAPALGFGNTVVWKPAEAASGSAVMLAEIFEEAGLPGGALNLVTGSGRELSDSLTGNATLAALTFTGSGPVGTRLRQSVADRNVKVQLELGGKNPVIVLADADLEHAADQIVRAAMLATGQRCTATSRVYVERTVAPKLQELILEKVSRLVVGDPSQEATDLGPPASAGQGETVAAYLELAAREGVEILAGGSSEGGTIQPTVLRGVDRTSRLMREEIFGPVLTLTEVEDMDEAVRQANDTDFGLSSAIFTRDLAKAMGFIKATESGVVHVNRETTGSEWQVPFGGVKGSSSMSREQGTAARQFFTTTKTVYIRS